MSVKSPAKGLGRSRPWEGVKCHRRAGKGKKDQSRSGLVELSVIWQIEKRTAPGHLGPGRRRKRGNLTRRRNLTTNDQGRGLLVGHETRQLERREGSHCKAVNKTHVVGDQEGLTRKNEQRAQFENLAGCHPEKKVFCFFCYSVWRRQKGIGQADGQ